MADNTRNEEPNNQLDLLMNKPTTSSNHTFTSYNVLKADDVDKTKHLLLKAKRMDPSIDVEQYLKDMRDARARNTISNGNAVPKERSRLKQPKHSIDDANTYLQIAENAITDTNYEWALIFLDKFDALYISERAVKIRKQLEKKSYCDGNLGNAGRLLKLAELLFPTKRAENEFEIVRFAYNHYIEPDSDESVPVENTVEFIVNNEVQRLINFGLHNMTKQNYDFAELAFQRAQYLEPSKKCSIDELISDVQTKKEQNKVEQGKEKFPCPQNAEGMSLKQYRNIKKQKKESNIISASNNYTSWGFDAFNHDDFENAETFLRLAEVFEFTEETRELFVMIAKNKNGLDVNSDSSDSEEDFIYCSVITESTENHIRQAEKAFIQGRMSEAWHLINKPKVASSPYVTELKQKIYILSPWNNFWIKIL